MFSAQRRMQIRYIPESQMMAIWDGVHEYCRRSKNPTKWLAIFTLLINYAPRVSEVLLLRRSDMDFGRKEIVFLTLKRRKKDPPEPPVTRTVGMLPDIIPILQAHFATLNGSEFVFPYRGNRQNYRRTVHIAFKMILKRAGLPSYRLHDLRHTGITWWLKRTDLAFTRDLAGHANIATTNQYIHAERYMERFQEVPARVA